MAIGKRMVELSFCVVTHSGRSLSTDKLPDFGVSLIVTLQIKCGLTLGHSGLPTVRGHCQLVRELDARLVLQHPEHTHTEPRIFVGALEREQPGAQDNLCLCGQLFV